MPTEIIKFRVPTGDKDAFANAAKAGGVTLSDLLRRAAKAAITGRIASRSVLTDLIFVRSLSHRLDAVASIANSDPRVSAEIKAAAASLRQIARRHLEAGQ
ncbi:hypothetical protein ABIB75_007813 [Bradyrhizobium sp. GM2.2]|uniref:hypothetical protein n=1 Tax=Bradyrhizobium sp. GM2.2 TaxID=3156358 RepID=UPI003394F097